MVDHSDWIRTCFQPLMSSHGFLLTPAEEIERRIAGLRRRMHEQGFEALLVVQKVDYFYLSGTSQDALLFLPSQGEPLLLVKRELERAKAESPLRIINDFKSIRLLPSLILEHTGKLPEVIGVEMDVLPAKDYFRLASLFPKARFADSSEMIRRLRAVKSPFEISLMRIAADIGKKVYHYAKEILKEGMTEIEFGGLLEAEAKRQGHEGLLRVRSYNYEAYSWHVLSGVTGGIVSQSDSPMGGLGLSPAFPVGASFKVMRANEPILIDFGTCYHGYQADQTRMFSVGKMPEKFAAAYGACREIHDQVLAQTRPGADCEALFLNTLKLAEKLGYKESYLGPPGLQCRFIGHGIGLELNELPFLAQGQSYALEEGMTFAVEPKIVFPGEGSAGLENTVAVTKEGCEILSTLELEIFEV